MMMSSYRGWHWISSTRCSTQNPYESAIYYIQCIQHPYKLPFFRGKTHPTPTRACAHRPQIPSMKRFQPLTQTSDVRGRGSNLQFDLPSHPQAPSFRMWLEPLVIFSRGIMTLTLLFMFAFLVQLRPRGSRDPRSEANSGNDSTDDLYEYKYTLVPRPT